MNENTKQSVEIVKIKTELQGLKENFDKFVSNDFQHLKDNLGDFQKETREKLNKIIVDYYKRPSWIVSALITALFGLVIALLVYLVK